jgi:hypothetical protein
MKPALTIIDGYATRKPSDWAEVELLPLAERTEEVLNALRELPVFNPPHDAYEPLEDFPAGYTVIPFDGVARTRFLFTINGEDYYINTEGSNYCRYALRLGTAVKPPVERRRDARRRELICTLEGAINKLRVALRNAHDDQLTVKDFEGIQAAATNATIAYEDFWNLTK